VATTDGLLLPIPELTDSADGPGGFGALANALEDYLYDRILPTGVTRSPMHHWSAGTAFPTGTAVKRGDHFFHTTYNVLCVYDGTNWRQAEIPVVTATDTTVGFYDGQQRIHPTNGLQLWRNNTWLNETEADERSWRKARLFLTSDIVYNVGAGDIQIGTAAGAWTVDYDAGPAGSANAMYATATPGRLTIRKAGEYRMRLMVAITGGTQAASVVARIGPSATPGTNIYASRSMVIYNGEAYVVVEEKRVFAANDFMIPIWWSNTSVAFTIRTAWLAQRTTFELEYLGPAPATPAS
jgi:hypothetical protein